MKEKKHCPNKAQFIVPWAGKLYNYCKIHANGMCALSQAIGAPIQVREIVSNDNCEGANDLEEYKIKA